MNTDPVPQVLLLLTPQLRRLQAPTGPYLMLSEDRMEVREDTP